MNVLFFRVHAGSQDPKEKKGKLEKMLVLKFLNLISNSKAVYTYRHTVYNS